MQLTVDSVIALSPDDASTKAAKGLLSPAKWANTGVNSQVIWGECKGSGSKPYQVQMDFSGPTFKCSCPSRKFPCKHGLALLLLKVQTSHVPDTETPPEWVQEWLKSRQERAEKQEKKKEAAASTPPDPKQAAKREATRNKQMESGMEDLQLWLNDLALHGLSSLTSQPGVWSDWAARMVDAKLPGLSNRLDAMNGIVGRIDHWQIKILAELGQLQLLLDGYKNSSALSVEEQTDIRSALGINQDKEEVIANGEKVADQWHVIGCSLVLEGRLWRRRIWLRGQNTQRIALLLEFAHGMPKFETNPITGNVITGELAFFPSAAPSRAVWVDMPVIEAYPAQLMPQTVDAAFDLYAQQRAACPWLICHPLWASHGKLQFNKEQQWTWITPLANTVEESEDVSDTNEIVEIPNKAQLLKLLMPPEQGWQLLASSQGRPFTLMGEWENNRFIPLSAWKIEAPHQLIWQMSTQQLSAWLQETPQHLLVS